MAQFEIAPPPPPTHIAQCPLEKDRVSAIPYRIHFSFLSCNMEQASLRSSSVASQVSEGLREKVDGVGI